MYAYTQWVGLLCVAVWAHNMTISWKDKKKNQQAKRTSRFGRQSLHWKKVGVYVNIFAACWSRNFANNIYGMCKQSQGLRMGIQSMKSG